MSDEQQDRDYPSWSCHDCGSKYGRRSVGIATWHIGICGVCGTITDVTEPRDFGHLKPKWQEQRHE